jgi:two-component system, cell cycle response regulator
MRKTKAFEYRNNTGPIILVVEDVEETRDGIEKLLTADGYRVNPARDEDDAIDRAKREPPALILVSVAGPHAQVITLAARVRQRAELSDHVPIVIFCIPSIAEGAEIPLGRNIYITRPDNFDQLRTFLKQLLRASPTF